MRIEEHMDEYNGKRDGPFDYYDSDLRGEENVSFGLEAVYV